MRALLRWVFPLVFFLSGCPRPCPAQTISRITNSTPERALTASNLVTVLNANFDAVKAILTNRTINPKEAPWSAAGDGVTDDSAALRSAFAAATNGVRVSMVTGRYKVSSKLPIPDGFQLSADGDVEILQVSDDTPIIWATNAQSNVRIEGIRFCGTGENPNVAYRGEVGVMVSNVFGGTLSTNFVVSGCTFTNFGSAGIWFQGTVAARAEGNHIYGTGASGNIAFNDQFQFGVYAIGNNSRLVVAGNWITETGMGVYCGHDSVQTTVDDNVMWNIRGQHGIYGNAVNGGSFSGNLIMDCARAGVKAQIEDASLPDGGNTLRMDNNVIVRAGAQAILLLNAQFNGTTDQLLWTNVSISHNLISGTNTWADVPSQSSVEGIYISYAWGVHAEGNVIRDRYVGISVHHTAESEFINNTISGTYEKALNLDTLTNVFFEGGRISGCQFVYSIYVNDDSTISFRNLRPDLGTGANLYAFYFDAACTGAGISIEGIRSPLICKFIAAATLKLWDDNQFASVSGFPPGLIKGRRLHVYSGTNAPASGGPFDTGDIVENPAPVLFRGWVCTVAGSPGTWAEYGILKHSSLLSWDTVNYTLGIGTAADTSFARPLKIRRDTNAFVSLYLQNNTSGTAAAAAFYAVGASASGAFGAFDSLYLDAKLADNVGINADSTATAIILQAQTTGQEIRFAAGEGAVTGKFNSSGLVMSSGKYLAADKLKVTEGSNARMGTATLAAGTVTVNTTAVAANSRIFLTTQSTGGTPGTVYVSARSAGTSFTITSTSGTDTSTVGWLIVEPQ